MQSFWSWLYPWTYFHRSHRARLKLGLTAPSLKLGWLHVLWRSCVLLFGSQTFWNLCSPLVTPHYLTVMDISSVATQDAPPSFSAEIISQFVAFWLKDAVNRVTGFHHEAAVFLGSTCGMMSISFHDTRPTSCQLTICWRRVSVCQVFIGWSQTQSSGSI